VVTRIFIPVQEAELTPQAWRQSVINVLKKLELDEAAFDEDFSVPDYVRTPPLSYTVGSAVVYPSTPADALVVVYDCSI
jgi:hypothetical protein